MYLIKNRSLLSALTLLLVSSLLPFTLAAQEELQPHRNERDYIIEVLIFTQPVSKNTTEKPGRAKIFEPLQQTALKIGPAPAWNRLSYLPLQLYTPTEPQLVKEAEALQRNSSYRLLFHDAWRMPVTAEERSLPLLIEGGEYYDGFPELQGQLKISVARYLHIETDLFFSRFKPLEDPLETSVTQLLQKSHNPLMASQPALPDLLQQIQADEIRNGSRLIEGRFQVSDSARMHQRRRMRSGELHMIDSPYIGLLIRIDRAPDEQEQEEEPKE